MHPKFRLLLIPAALTALLAGCGPQTALVTGTVTVDGQPVSGGVISYVSAEADAPPATANIEAGKYELNMLAGKKFVQISAPKVVSQRKEYDGPDAPLVDITEERLPPKYNSQTELTFEARPGENKQDWNLKSGK